MDIENNSKCFTFETLHFGKGIFDDSIDCTYVIHLLQNGRLEHIYDEIKRTIPSKTVVIAKNLGYKKCNKKLIENAPYQDLTDAFLQCFSHAKKNGYKNIMILEDDFIFRQNIETSDIEKITNFTKSNTDKEYVLSLGAVPFFIYPSLYSGMYKSKTIYGMHCNIYSQKLIENMDKLDVTEKHWDVIIEKNVKNQYIFYRPICYQTFPETENKKTWTKKDTIPIIGKIKDGFIYGLNLHKTPEPGFTIMYYFAKFLFLFVVGIIVFIIYYIFTKLTNKSKILEKIGGYRIKKLRLL